MRPVIDCDASHALWGGALAVRPSRAKMMNRTRAAPDTRKATALPFEDLYDELE